MAAVRQLRLCTQPFHVARKGILCRAFHSSLSRPKNRVYDASIRNEDEFNSLLLVSASSRQPLVTLWTASWCPSCKIVKPLIKDLVQKGAGEKEGGIGFVEVEADAPDLQNLLMRYGITSIPTLLAFSRQEAQVGTKSTNIADLKNKSFVNRWLASEASRGGQGGAGGDGLFGLFNR